MPDPGSASQNGLVRAFRDIGRAGLSAPGLPEALDGMLAAVAPVIPGTCLSIMLFDQDRRDLVQVLDDRYGLRSTIMTSQLPVAKWHDHIGDPTSADAICDRVLHNAHRLVLKGPSRRKEDSVKTDN